MRLKTYLVIERLLIDAREVNDSDLEAELDTMCFASWDLLSESDKDQLRSRTGTIDDRNPVKIIGV